ncbi:MAG: hypothetical protein ACHQT6_09055 [Candidatus Acidiferrales bacterium]
MKRLLWVASLACAVVLSACGGGGGSNIPPPPPAGGFTLSSLKGQFAFSMSGLDTFGAYLARTGSFNADGAGNITSAMEDVVDLNAGTATEVTFAASHYSVQANGRGVIVLQDGSGSGLTLTMVLQSPSQGFLLETDAGGGTSGSFNLQTTTDFAPTALNGNYVFDFAGESLTGATPTVISTIGNITATGNGIITGGVIDINDGNAGLSSAVNILPGTYTLDPANGAAFGRGTAQFAGHTFAFYIVDATRIKFLQEDSQGGSTGDAVLQSGAIPTTNAGFTGSFAYLIGGSSLSTFGPDVAVARFTADGAGGIGTISYDENDSSSNSPIHISQGSNISNATYAIDTTNAGSGRGTLTFTDSSHGTFQYVFYLLSPTSGVFQDVSNGFVADGTLFAQTGSPFTLAGLAGNYSFSWSGVGLSTSSVENYVGQYVLASTATNNISGVVDATSLDANGVASFPNSGVQGTLTITSDGSTNNTYQISAGNSVSSTYNFQAYIVDANTVLLLSTDKAHVLAGFVSRQSQ